MATDLQFAFESQPLERNDCAATGIYVTKQGYRDIYYTAPDGLKLHARLYGEDNDPALLPVVCLPGLTRNARDFHPLALYLSRHAAQPRKVVTFDYRGRGLSEHDKNWRNYNAEVEASDIASGLTAMGIDRGAFIGTSRGGLIMFALAASRPAFIKVAILNDIGPVIEGEGLAHIRAYLERTPAPANFANAVAIQKIIHAEAFPALNDTDWLHFTATLYRKDEERLIADFDPNVTKPLIEIDLSEPLPALWSQFHGLGRIPLLAIRGQNSRLLSADTLERMARRHESMEAITVEGQGHAPLLQTGNLPHSIASFIDRAERRSKHVRLTIAGRR